MAHRVWERFGDVPNYVEPFAGSLAVMLARPHEPRTETVNDLDCFIANFWRAVRTAPEEVARWADWPINEADLHSRHRWLVGQEEFREKLKTDPDFFDAKIAGWWVWGISCWIGSGWCAKPEWRPRVAANQSGIHRKRPRLSGYSDAGVHSRNPRNAGPEIWRKRPELKRGQRGCLSVSVDINEWMFALANRLRRVRVCCGDWQRVLGRSPTECVGLTGIFLDPPYAMEERDSGLYLADAKELSVTVREWAVQNGSNPMFRIALCGYEGEHEMPEDWGVVRWKTNGGNANASNGRGVLNAGRERIWFSPHCLGPASPELFAAF